MSSGKRTPYTERGIKRAKCFRCGGQAVHQWNICSDGGYRALCVECDIALNGLVLGFMRFPLKERFMKLRRYAKRARKAVAA